MVSSSERITHIGYVTIRQLNLKTNSIRLDKNFRFEKLCFIPVPQQNEIGIHFVSPDLKGIDFQLPLFTPSVSAPQSIFFKFSKSFYKPITIKEVLQIIILASLLHRSSNICTEGITRLPSLQQQRDITHPDNSFKQRLTILK